jgi:uncharacterized protein (TIGR02284 family)
MTYRSPFTFQGASEEIEALSGDAWLNSYTADILNKLIRICNDGNEGYQQAAALVKSPWLARLFEDCAAQRGQFAVELSHLVSEMGITPANGPTVGGALHRTWIDFRTAFVADGTVGDVLQECDRGEDAAEQAYQDALEKALPVPMQKVVQSQYESIVKAHNQIRDLRNEFRREI